MRGLSLMFFCLSPFALFCTEDGNGLILCPVFIVLGFVFRWIGKKLDDAQRDVVRVDPKEFWECHYKDRMRSTLVQKDAINDGVMALKDKEARSWATTMCGYNNAPVPPEAEQEQIARINGVITEQMIKERGAGKDRIQIGKYFLLKKLAEKYSGKEFGEGLGGKCYCPWVIIKDDLRKIKLSNGHSINEKLIEYDYKMSLGSIWNGLSEPEKIEIVKWVTEYEERLIKLINIYIEDGRYCSSVDMVF